MKILTSSRHKELIDKEAELYILKHNIDDLKVWCTENSVEIGAAMVYLQQKDKHWTMHSVAKFRDVLRSGKIDHEWLEAQRDYLEGNKL